MRLHPRTLPVQAASGEIRTTLWRLQDEHGLTYVEMLRVVNDHAQDITKYLLREERHPGDPDHKDDES